MTSRSISTALLAGAAIVTLLILGTMRGWVAGGDSEPGDLWFPAFAALVALAVRYGAAAVRRVRRFLDLRVL